MNAIIRDNIKFFSLCQMEIKNIAHKTLPSNFNICYNLSTGKDTVTIGILNCAQRKM